MDPDADPDDSPLRVSNTINRIELNGVTKIRSEASKNLAETLKQAAQRYALSKQEGAEGGDKGEKGEGEIKDKLCIDDASIESDGEDYVERDPFDSPSKLAEHAQFESMTRNLRGGDGPGSPSDGQDDKENDDNDCASITSSIKTEKSMLDTMRDSNEEEVVRSISKWTSVER